MIKNYATIWVECRDHNDFAKDMEELQSSVRAAIKNGWQPLGAPYVVQFDINTGTYPRIKVCQALAGY